MIAIGSQAVAIATQDVAVGQRLAFVIWWNKTLDELIEGWMPDLDPATMFGMPTPGQGFWIWEGYFVVSTDGYMGVGEYRRPNDKEWAAIKAGSCPWPGGA